jgi:hypothetical protein
LEELRNDAYDCARLYKARMKKVHGQNILRRSFEPGQKVLLYNLRLHLFPGKLRSRWTGPFIVRSIFSDGTIEIEIDIEDQKSFDSSVGLERLNMFESFITSTNLRHRIYEA